MSLSRERASSGVSGVGTPISSLRPRRATRLYQVAQCRSLPGPCPHSHGFCRSDPAQAALQYAVGRCEELLCARPQLSDAGGWKPVFVGCTAPQDSTHGESTPLCRDARRGRNPAPACARMGRLIYHQQKVSALHDPGQQAPRFVPLPRSGDRGPRDRISGGVWPGAGPCLAFVVRSCRGPGVLSHKQLCHKATRRCHALPTPTALPWQCSRAARMGCCPTFVGGSHGRPAQPRVDHASRTTHLVMADVPRDAWACPCHRALQCPHVALLGSQDGRGAWLDRCHLGSGVGGGRGEASGRCGRKETARGKLWGPHADVSGVRGQRRKKRRAGDGGFVAAQTPGAGARPLSRGQMVRSVTCHT